MKAHGATWDFVPYALPLRIPYRWAKGTQRERHGLWVSCTQDGVTGWGETAPAPHLGIPGEELAFQARAALEAGGDGGSLESALDEAGTDPRIRHGLACARADAEARRDGLPLARHLTRRHGVPRPPAREVPVNALIGAVGAAEAGDAAREAVAAGFRTLKVKSDGSTERDVARLEAIRGEVGDAVRLRVDANEAWDPEHALAHLRRLEAFGIEYVEQPVRAGRFQDLVALCRDSPVPVALDESLTQWDVVERFLQAGARPVLIVKPQRLGGPDRVLDLVARADQAGLQTIVTNSLETAVGRTHALHLASLLRPPVPDCGLATEHFLAVDVEGVRTRRGVQAVPEGPGLGIQPKVGDALQPWR